MAETASVMEKVVDETLLDAIDFYIDERDKLLRTTYMLAYRYSQSAQVCFSPLLLATNCLTQRSAKKNGISSGRSSGYGAPREWRVDPSTVVAKRHSG